MRRGRPKKENAKDIILKVRMDKELYDDLSRHSALIGLSRAEVIRRSLRLVVPCFKSKEEKE